VERRRAKGGSRPDEVLLGEAEERETEQITEFDVRRLRRRAAHRGLTRRLVPAAEGVRASACGDPAEARRDDPAACSPRAIQPPTLGAGQSADTVWRLAARLPIAHRDPHTTPPSIGPRTHRLVARPAAAASRRSTGPPTPPRAGSRAFWH
jgi:hypothetical protein